MFKVEKIKSKNYTLINGDCINYLSKIPDNSIDLILTDPPYNIAQYSTGNISLPGRSALNNDLGDWDLKEIDPFLFVKDFKRILKPDGNIFIVDRIKRMIVRHDGFKVFPSMIENVILKNDCVHACCVVGVRDTAYRQGDLPFAYVVLKNCPVAENDLRNELDHLCETALPEYAQPASYAFIDSLPVTSIGKVDYRALEEMAKEDTHHA